MVLNVVIMAAGKGTRMRSARPKVLHRLAGRHLLQHVLDAAAGLGASRTIVVTGHGAAEVEQATGAPGLAFVRQEPQLGTGHALQQAAPLLDDAGTTLVLNGDVPLIEVDTLQALIAASGGEQARPAHRRPRRPERLRPGACASGGRDHRDRRGEGRERRRSATSPRSTPA